MKIPFPWNGDINWLKNELIALWGAYGFIVDPKGNGGKLYYGDASYGNLVSEIAVNAKTYGPGPTLARRRRRPNTLHGHSRPDRANKKSEMGLSRQ